MNTSYKIAYMLRNFYESVPDKSNYKDFSETGLHLVDMSWKLQENIFWRIPLHYYKIMNILNSDFW